MPPKRRGFVRNAGQNMATRILVVDGNAEARNALSLSLSVRGYEVTTVSGAQAFAAFWAGTPDIVLIEVVMPDKCGIELIREIDRANKDTRIIATSAGGALARDYLLNIARKLGADLTLPRPFTIDQLLAGIEQILERPAGGDRKDIV
jgi:DNA-binding response OmpR family regulator